MNEDKARFFAQYYGQNVVSNKESLKGLYSNIDFTIMELIFDQSIEDDYFFLELTSLDQITDEHAIEVARIIGKDNYPIGCDNNDLMAAKTVCYWFTENIGDFENFIGALRWERLISFLRSKGYLVPFDKYSCKEILEKGWAKAKET